jgi:hypothetical protein
MIATHLARFQRYCHIDETLDTIAPNGPIKDANLDRRRYGSAMQIPAATHGTVDQVGSH